MITHRAGNPMMGVTTSASLQTVRKPVELKKRGPKKRGAARGGQYSANFQEDFPVHAAVANDDIDALEALVGHKADLNEIDRSGDTPLIIAIKANNLNMIAKLLDEGAEVTKSNAHKHSPIAIASNLENRECMDILSQYGASITPKSGRDDYDLSEDASDFVSELIQLLSDDINNVRLQKDAQSISNRIIATMEAILDIKSISAESLESMKAEITRKIALGLEEAHKSVRYSDKAILKLSRRIIIVMQNHRDSLSTALAWMFNKVESIIEERIVSNPEEDRESTSAYAGVNKNAGSSTSTQTANASSHFEKPSPDSLRTTANESKYSKFLDIGTERFLRGGTSHRQETLDVTTIKPRTLTNKEELALLLPDASKRLTVEAELMNIKADSDEMPDKIKGSRGFKALDPINYIKLDDKLRSAKKNGIHLVHFHHDHSPKNFLTDLMKESFLTGATVIMFNSAGYAATPEQNAVSCGIAIINQLIDQEIHPDKIILQGYGAGILIANQVNALFSKQGLELCQINYHHSMFGRPMYLPEQLCLHRQLNVYDASLYTKKMQKNTKCHAKYQSFAKYISRYLKKAKHDVKSASLTDISLRQFSFMQLINLFIQTSQHFIRTEPGISNPLVPCERIERQNLWLKVENF